MDQNFIKKIKYLVENNCLIKRKINFPENTNLETIRKILKQHHRHISITEQRKQNLTKNKMPEIKLSNNILIIKFYQYIYNNDTNFYNKYVKFVQNNLEKYINENEIKGIIIDLTKHTGGWMNPFIECLSTTILNNTTLFKFTKDNKTNDSTWWNVKNKKIIIGNFMGNKINTDLNIAVLVSKHTKSSGEICASIFKRKLKNIKIFGEDTFGYLTVNMTYKIDEKYSINIPITYCETVDKKIQKKEYLEPDIYTNKPKTEARIWINDNK